MKQYFLLFLTIFSVAVGQEGHAGFFKNPKVVKVLKIGGGIAITGMCVAILWNRVSLEDYISGTNTKPTKEGKIRGIEGFLAPTWKDKKILKPSSFIIDEFIKIFLGNAKDAMDCEAHPVSKEIIVNTDKVNALELFGDTKREIIIYILTYKPGVTQLRDRCLWHPIVLEEAEHNKDKNFYLLTPWSPFGMSFEEYRRNVFELNGRYMGRKFLAMLSNLRKCERLPIKKENIRFLTSSHEVLTFEEVCEVYHIRN